MCRPPVEDIDEFLEVLVRANRAWDCPAPCYKENYLGYAIQFMVDQQVVLQDQLDVLSAQYNELADRIQ